MVSFPCEGLKGKPSPATVGIFYSFSKFDNIDDCLKEFIDELRSLSNGYNLGGSHLIALKIACFLCDAPATVSEGNYFP